MLIVSFVTKNTDYEKTVKKYLIDSCEKFNLSYDIDYIEDKGSWNKNILYKSEFLKKMLLKHKQPIVSLDSDARILKYPHLFEEMNDYDIGVHTLDWGAQWHKPHSDKKEVLGGTLYFTYNDKVLSFLNEWITITKTELGFPQKTLQKLLKENKNNLKVYPIPYSYSTILTHKNTIPEHMINPNEVVILHYQISRILKRKLR
jgi:hypothetical protein